MHKFDYFDNNPYRILAIGVESSDIDVLKAQERFIKISRIDRLEQFEYELDKLIKNPAKREIGVVQAAAKNISNQIFRFFWFESNHVNHYFDTSISSKEYLEKLNRNRFIENSYENYDEFLLYLFKVIYELKSNKFITIDWKYIFHHISNISLQVDDYFHLDNEMYFGCRLNELDDEFKILNDVIDSILIILSQYSNLEDFVVINDMLNRYYMGEKLGICVNVFRNRTSTLISSLSNIVLKFDDIQRERNNQTIELEASKISKIVTNILFSIKHSEIEEYIYSGTKEYIMDLVIDLINKLIRSANIKTANEVFNQFYKLFSNEDRFSSLISKIHMLQDVEDILKRIYPFITKSEKSLLLSEEEILSFEFLKALKGTANSMFLVSRFIDPNNLRTIGKVKKSTIQSKRWTELAIKYGSSDAEFDTGYEQIKNGVTLNEIMYGDRLLRQAASKGNQEAKQIIDMYDYKMLIYRYGLEHRQSIRTQFPEFDPYKELSKWIEKPKSSKEVEPVVESTTQVKHQTVEKSYETTQKANNVGESNLKKDEIQRNNNDLDSNEKNHQEPVESQARTRLNQSYFKNDDEYELSKNGNGNYQYNSDTLDPLMFLYAAFFIVIIILIISVIT